MAKNQNQIVTPEFRLHFPTLFEPKAFMRNGKAQGEPKYSGLALFAPDTDLKDLKAMAVKAAREMWPDITKEALGPIFNALFKSGDGEAARLLRVGKTEEQVKAYRGQTLVKFSSGFKPQVVDTKGNDILDASKVYAGCYARAELNFVAVAIPAPNSPTGENRFLTAYVNMVLKTRDGDRLTGRTAKDVFKAILGGESNADPTGGADDIPF